MSLKFKKLSLQKHCRCSEPLTTMCPITAEVLVYGVASLPPAATQGLGQPDLLPLISPFKVAAQAPPPLRVLTRCPSPLPPLGYSLDAQVPAFPPPPYST